MQHKELLAQIENVKLRIENSTNIIREREEAIRILVKLNSKETYRLRRLYDDLEEMQLQTIRKKRTKKRGKQSHQPNSANTNVKTIGLNHKPILFPVAKCDLHDCYLSYKNIQKKDCLNKFCKHFHWVTDESVNPLK